MFKKYNSIPKCRLAYQITEDDKITSTTKEATSLLLNKDVEYGMEFKHTAPVNVGDYIIPIAENDVYHCPKDVFEGSYHCESSGMTFGQAIEAAKSGNKIAREGWNGAGMFAYIVPAASCEMYGIEKEIFGVEHELALRKHWRLKTAQDDIATWAPSGSDSLADDWCIVS